MTFLEQALSLAEKGFYVFPLHPGTKNPVIDDFPNRATRDPEQIKKFWTDPVMELPQPYNIGISTTRYNGSQALIVADVDNKGKKKGSEEVLKLELEGYDFIETATQVTPTGGKHLIYRAKEPVKQGVDVLAKGIDIRSKGGYIVGPGSVVDGKTYDWENNLEVKECPKWIIEKCGTPLAKDETAVDTSAINKNRAYARAVNYLENEAPLATEGDAGDATTFAVAAKLKDFGLDQKDALEWMLAHWNERCSPPWGPEELEIKVRNAFEYGKKKLGSDAPETTFTPVKEMNEKNYLQEMNKEYALIFENGGHSIIYETVDEKGNPARIFLKELSFKRKFSTKTVQQGKGQARTYAEVWLDWGGRREYAGLCFAPEREVKHNYYNLWRGFTVKPKSYADAGVSARLGFDMFIDHAKKNVCHGDDALFTWLMGYFAHLVQKPYERPLTTLVFRGAKGVGKNMLVDRIGNLLGNGHYLVAHDSRYLTSNFNGHMDSCLCLVLDEAFWSGDKSAEGKLKGITTSPTTLIERKGKEPYIVDNLVRLIVIGNEYWLVPASSDERRYAVYDVGEGRKQDGTYFEKMRILMDSKGGNEILLHYLKNFDLSRVDVNSAPATVGLADQKMSSLSAFEQFWFECLTEGKLVYSDFNSEWQTEVDKSTFRRAFTAYTKSRNIKSWVPDNIHIGKLLKKISPTCQTDQRTNVEGGRLRSYRFKDLKTCREEWDKFIGHTRNWD